MGEIDVVTRRIDDLQGRIQLGLMSQETISVQIDQAKKQFVITLNNLITQAGAFKENQVKSIQDQLAISKIQMERETTAQIEVFTAASRERSHDQINLLQDTAHQANKIAVLGVLETIEQKFDQALHSVADANKSFTEVKTLFIKDVKQCVEGAAQAVKKYDLALQISAADHRPIGAWGFFWLTLLASAISVGGMAGFMSWRSAGETPEQKEMLARGAKFQEVYQKLDAQTKAKIDKLWK